MARLFPLALGVVLFTSSAGCGKKNGSSASKKPGAGGAGSPEAVFSLQFKLMRENRFDRLYSLYCKAARQVIVDIARETRRIDAARFRRQYGFDPKELDGLKPREVFVKLSSARFKRLSLEKLKEISATPKIDRVVREGPDRVMLRFKRFDQQCRQRFRREGGAWKIAGVVACKKRTLRPGPPPRKTGGGS